jgi:hypothetical protein
MTETRIIDIDDAIVLYNYSTLTFDQVWELEGLHPGVIKALLHIAIQRSDPSLREREIAEMVGAVNMMDVMEQLSVIAEEAPDPTKGGAPPVEDDSKRSSDEPTGSSGTDGSATSEPSPENSSPGSTGVPTSDSTATSDQPTLVP